jgi:hypothetical protein
MNRLADSKSIFEQLADTDGQGVQTLIETHDAWVHNTAVLAQITAALRAQLAQTPRPASVSRRLAEQQHALQPLVITIRRRLATAG